MGSRYGHTPLGSDGPSLQLGTDTVAASDHVRVQAWRDDIIGAQSGQARATSPTCVRSIFSGFAN